MRKIFFLISALFLSSCSNYGQLTFVTKLPTKLKENSGIIYNNDSTLWVILDKGNPDKLYKTDFHGKLLDELKVDNAKNEDWEDLARDEKGNVYIADTGNNNGKRNELTIYKLPNPQTEKGNKIDAEKINFYFSDKKIFGSEAIFYHKNFIYIITKDRARPFTGEAQIYKVPAQKGDYDATFIGKFTPCDDVGVCEVTAADISPDGKTIAVLGYGKLWIFTDFASDDFSQGKMKTIDLEATTQLESICFMDENTLLLSDEERGNTGRNLYSFRIKN